MIELHNAAKNNIVLKRKLMEYFLYELNPQNYFGGLSQRRKTHSHYLLVSDVLA